MGLHRESRSALGFARADHGFQRRYGATQWRHTALRSHDDPSKCVGTLGTAGDPNSYFVNGAAAVYWDCHEHDDQLWYLTDEGFIQSRLSAMLGPFQQRQHAERDAVRGRGLHGPCGPGVGTLSATDKSATIFLRPFASAARRQEMARRSSSSLATTFTSKCGPSRESERAVSMPENPKVSLSRHVATHVASRQYTLDSKSDAR